MWKFLHISLMVLKTLNQLTPKDDSTGCSLGSCVVFLVLYLLSFCREVEVIARNTAWPLNRQVNYTNSLLFHQEGPSEGLARTQEDWIKTRKAHYKSSDLGGLNLGELPFCCLIIGFQICWGLPVGSFHFPLIPTSYAKHWEFQM